MLGLCAAAALSRWKLPANGASGHVVDDASGRCLSVLDCALPSAQPQLNAAQMGVAVLDECGAGPCAGKNQQWTVATSSKPGELHLVRSPPSIVAVTPQCSSATSSLTALRKQVSALQPWKLMGTFSPQQVNGEHVVVQSMCVPRLTRCSPPGTGRSGSQASRWLFTCRLDHRSAVTRLTHAALCNCGDPGVPMSTTYANTRNLSLCALRAVFVCRPRDARTRLLSLHRRSTFRR